MRIPEYDQTLGSESLHSGSIPQAGLAATFSSQIVPRTPHMIDLNAAFEKAVYDTLKQKA
jgi:hypothetical protein